VFVNRRSTSRLLRDDLQHGYDNVVANDNIPIVDPATRKVVEVIREIAEINAGGRKAD